MNSPLKMKKPPKDPSKPIMGNHQRSNSAITFGYDYISPISSYRIDYGIKSLSLNGSRELLIKQLPEAEVLPQFYGSNKDNWMTSNRRDLAFYSNDLRREVYRQRLQEFNCMRNMCRTRNWSSGSYHLPPITSYNTDYIYPFLPSTQLKAQK